MRLLAPPVRTNPSISSVSFKLMTE
jgi:hypothetical protein